MRSIKDDERGLVACSGAAAASVALGWTSLRFERNGGGCSFGALAASFESSVGSAASVAPTDAVGTTGAAAASSFGLPKTYFILATLAMKARSYSSSTMALSVMPLEEALRFSGGAAGRSSDDGGRGASAPPPPNSLPTTEYATGWSRVDSLVWSTIGMNQLRVARTSRPRPRSAAGARQGGALPADDTAYDTRVKGAGGGHTDGLYY